MCTSIKIKATSGELFWGRTMDLDIPLFADKSGFYLPCVITSIPANVEIESQLNSWKSKYSVVGVGIKESPVLFDGINEHGLAGDTQVLTECGWAEKAAIDAAGKTPFIAEEFVTFILTNFKTVSEIREQVENFMLLNQSYKYGGTEFHFPLHFSFIDESGDAIVLETTEDGKFVSFEHMNVMTNSPRYDYHQVNIRNYIGMQNVNISDSRTLPNGIEIDPIEGGTGYGMFGIPGDYTSPSRFVRAFCLSNALEPFEKEEGINELYSAFRTVFIPKGLERNEKNTNVSDYTRYWSGYDISKRQVFVQTGKGLAITTKTLENNLDSISYEEIQLAL
ncbi:linear amide C-N hydrolase [Enterococcus sp. 5H]|uniref:linear amide C-N hydrolase n=1 Tax=Enterococcus sp. 5H TaxID=1229490 RepID=UPI002303C0CC|nr:linear amide C-N hydrolase [Enterococcus sp. 5H]MDA9472770.1 Choloylglycine hydrolase [Enterococcus sp. 5H]